MSTVEEIISAPQDLFLLPHGVLHVVTILCHIEYPLLLNRPIPIFLDFGLELDFFEQSGLDYHSKVWTERQQTTPAQ